MTLPLKTDGQKFLASEYNEIRSRIQEGTLPLNATELTLTPTSTNTALTIDLLEGTATGTKFIDFRTGNISRGYISWDSTNSELDFVNASLAIGSGSDIILENNRSLKFGDPNQSTLKYNSTSGLVEYAGVDIDIKTGAFRIGSTVLFENDRDIAVNLLPNEPKTLNLGNTTRTWNAAYFGSDATVYYGDAQQFFEKTVTSAGSVYFVRSDGAYVIYSGVADLAAAITAAYTALPNTGGKIIIPAGTYTWSTAAILTTKPLQLEGAGSGLTIINVANLGIATQCLTFTSITGLKVTGLTFDGQRNLGYTTNGVFSNTGSDQVFKDCTFKNFHDPALGGGGGMVGLLCRSIIDLTVQGCRFITNDSGLDWQSSIGSCTSNYSNGNDRIGLNFYQVGVTVSSRITITTVSNNVSTSNGTSTSLPGHGIRINRCTSLLVTNNYLAFNYQYGTLAYQSCDDIQIVANTCYQNQRNGILLEGDRDGVDTNGIRHCQVNDNICEGNTFYGIRLYDVHYSIVADNKCRVNGTGISETHNTGNSLIDSDHNTFRGNDTRSNTDAGIDIGGTGSIQYDNDSNDYYVTRSDGALVIAATVADMGVAITAAYAALPNRGGRIILPTGSFTSASSILLENRNDSTYGTVYIEGAGFNQTTTIQLTAGSVQTTFLSLKGSSHHIIRNIEFDANNLAKYAVRMERGAAGTGAGNHEIENTKFANATQCNVLVYGAENVKLINVRGDFGSPIGLMVTSLPPVTDPTVNNAIPVNLAGTLQSTNGLVLQNCHFGRRSGTTRAAIIAYNSHLRSQNLYLEADTTTSEAVVILDGMQNWAVFDSTWIDQAGAHGFKIGAYPDASFTPTLLELRSLVIRGMTGTDVLTADYLKGSVIEGVTTSTTASTMTLNSTTRRNLVSQFTMVDGSTLVVTDNASNAGNFILGTSTIRSDGRSWIIGNSDTFNFGTSNAATFTRQAASILELTGTVAGSVRYGMSGSGTPFLALRSAAADTNAFLQTDTAGIKFGAGGASSYDALLTRTGANSIALQDGATNYTTDFSTGRLKPGVTGSADIGTTALFYRDSYLTTITIKNAGAGTNPSFSSSSSGNYLNLTGSFRLTGDLNPTTDNASVLGQKNARWIDAYSKSFSVINASGDTQPISRLNESGLFFGAGGTSAVDTDIHRTGANALQLTASGGITLTGALLANGDNTLNIGSTTNHFAKAYHKDDLIVDTATKGLVLKDTQATPHFWRVTVSNAGALVITDIGTTEP